MFSYKQYSPKLKLGFVVWYKVVFEHCPDEFKVCFAVQVLDLFCGTKLGSGLASVTSMGVGLVCMTKLVGCIENMGELNSCLACASSPSDMGRVDWPKRVNIILI